jgi:phosphoenolpyruvate carboxykinase (GTP)
MAMKPFCGYNFADYWAHWLSFAERSNALPRIFHVNWFRQDSEGRFLWPGFGENLRVLRWIIDRCTGRAGAVESPIGLLPGPGEIDTTGLELADETLQELTTIEPALWKAEMRSIGDYFGTFGDRLPHELRDEYQKVLSQLEQGPARRNRISA